MELTILNVKDIVRLIQKVNCQNYAFISEIAKEMGVKKTQVMMYIESHPKLFRLVEVKKKDKVLGLAVSTVYTDAYQNPDTEEWMDKKVVEWDHKLHVGGQYYYGYLEFWYFPEERADSKESKYRNSRAKFEQLEEMGILQKTTQGYGGLSDYYKTVVYPCNQETLKKLAEAGWSTDFEEVSAAESNK